MNISAGKRRVECSSHRSPRLAAGALQRRRQQRNHVPLHLIRWVHQQHPSLLCCPLKPKRRRLIKAKSPTSTTRTPPARRPLAAALTALPAATQIHSQPLPSLHLCNIYLCSYSDSFSSPKSDFDQESPVPASNSKFLSSALSHGFSAGPAHSDAKDATASLSRESSFNDSADLVSSARSVPSILQHRTTNLLARN